MGGGKIFLLGVSGLLSIYVYNTPINAKTDASINNFYYLEAEEGM
jgi:hypothetical protein